MLTLPADITTGNAAAVTQALQQQLQALPARTVVVEGAGLQKFDSSALAVLLALHRTALQKGAVLNLQHMPPRLEGLATLYGVASLLWPQAVTAEAE